MAKLYPLILVSTVRYAAGGVMVWHVFFCHYLDPIPIEHQLKSTAYLFIVVDHVHLFNTGVVVSVSEFYGFVANRFIKLRCRFCKRTMKLRELEIDSSL